MTNQSTSAPLLEVRDLAVEFDTHAGTLHAVNGVSFSLNAGETLGIVGESGCGKSTVARALMGLISDPGRVSAGSILFEGVDLVSAPEAHLRKVRGAGVAMVFQDAMSALNPVMTVGQQICEAIAVHSSSRGRLARARAIELLGLVGIPDPARRFDAYPHELSGGMRQRAMIAMAISCEPRLLIADEPTTALDVTVQAQILELLRRLQDELGMAIILVSHDLGVVAGLTRSIQVMYGGLIVEQGPVDDVLLRPTHPYTEALVKSLALIDEPRPDRLRAIPGAAPILLEVPQECPFWPRCPEAHDRCRQANPPLITVGPTQVACWARVEADVSRESA